MHPLIEAHRSEIVSLARLRGATSVKLFGSMVGADVDPDSDVDLLVTLWRRARAPCPWVAC